MARQIPPTRRSPWAGRNVALAVTAAVAAAAVGLIVARVVDDGDQGPTGVTGVSHVHGLGINPADGSLIVATHYGSFRIAADSDDASKIGDSSQDTMGFTVAGPDHFLGSGHPDLAGARAGQPTQLGLIESTDGGETWTALSLSGEVDFHGLAFAHDQVYGWDSGTSRFMVSTDRRQWETRSTIDLYGFAVDPADLDHIVGAAPTGLTESSDGGRTWADADGPTLVTVSWQADAGLWGADAGGAVWQRDRATWQRVGALAGEPQAFLATTDALYTAVYDSEGVTAIYRSTDEGQTWVLRYRDDTQ